MERVLGHFTTSADVKKARRNGKLAAWLVFAAIAGAALRLSAFLFVPIGAVNAIAVYAILWRVFLSRSKKGELDVVDDPEHGVVLVLRREGPGLRVPLSKAQLVGRTRTLAASGPVRLQIEIRVGDHAIACNLAVPFRPSDRDVDGIVPAAYDLDREASRALDALSYEVAHEDTA